MNVFKYEIPLDEEFTLQLPVGARILSFQVQDGQPMIWALVNVHAPFESRQFLLCGTGHKINEDRIQSYIGTIQLLEGKLVFHLFEAFN